MDIKLVSHKISFLFLQLIFTVENRRLDIEVAMFTEQKIRYRSKQDFTEVVHE